MKNITRSLSIITLISFISCAQTSELKEDMELESISQMIAKGDSSEGILKLESEFLTKYPDNDMGWAILGNLYEFRNQNQKARNAYNRAIKINSQNEYAFTGMGIIYRKEGDSENAAKCYRKALEINPEHAQAYSSLGVIELLNQNFDEAQKLLEKAVFLDEDDPVLVSNLSIVYHFQGNMEKRDEMFEKAKSMNYRHLQNLRLIYEGKLTIFE